MRVTPTAKLTNLWPSFPNRIGIWSVSFCGGKKTGEPGEKPSKQCTTRTNWTNSIHMWRRVRESNPDHSGERRALSRLHHPSSPILPLNWSAMKRRIGHVRVVFLLLCLNESPRERDWVQNEFLLQVRFHANKTIFIGIILHEESFWNRSTS